MWSVQNHFIIFENSNQRFTSNQTSFNPKPLKTMETALQLHPVRQEIIPLPTQHPINISQPVRTNKTTPFIEANTKEVSLRHLQSDCVVPVFSKDNEVTI